jgi:F-type H+-transporting ATPase subunit epsilon
MSNFTLSIHTPNGSVIKGLACEEFTIPTLGGEINVLPGHTHVISEIDHGVLTAKTSSGDRHFTMTAGLCKILGNEVTILSTTSEKVEDIDIERAKAAQAKAESRLQNDQDLTDVDRIKFLRKLNRAKLRVEAANLK